MVLRLDKDSKVCHKWCCIPIFVKIAPGISQGTPPYLFYLIIIYQICYSSFNENYLTIIKGGIFLGCYFQPPPSLHNQTTHLVQPLPVNNQPTSIPPGAGPLPPLFLLRRVGILSLQTDKNLYLKCPKVVYFFNTLLVLSSRIGSYPT